MYADDPHHPHCHIRFAGEEMMVDIISLEVIEGSLPKGIERKALDWCKSNQPFLELKWKELHAGRI